MGTFRTRTTTAAAVVLLALGALPGTAAVAAERPLPQPVPAELHTNDAACTTGKSPSFVRSSPVARAVLRDPGGQSSGKTVLTGQFEAWWKDAAGQVQRRTHATEFVNGRNATVQWPLPQDVPAQTPVSWRLRVSDGTGWSPWSDEGAGAACRFVYDNEVPEPPKVSSADFPQDDSWHDGVGIHTSFQVSSSSKDVVSYRYSFVGGGALRVAADDRNGSAVIPHLAERSGADVLTVAAVDRAGNVGAPTSYHFRVKTAREPVARWKLGDPAGSATATAESGPVARVGKGVSFGAQGPAGTTLKTAAALDGSGNGFLSPDAPVVRPGTTFAVSAWVRPDRLDRTMTVVSQDAGAGALFHLGLRPDGASPGWSFAVGGTRVVGGAPVVGRWTHLTGIYDSVQKSLRLYVDGREAGTAQRVKSPSASGDLQVGRMKGPLGHRDRWQGALADVQVHDRVVVPAEAAENARRKPVPNGNWTLESAPDGKSPDLDGGQPLTLHGGATIGVTDPLNFDSGGYLELDGTDDHASTARPVTDTTDSFTVAARVRLTGPTDGGPMTVFSQGGAHADAFKVRYLPESSQWQLVLTDGDRTAAREWVAAQFWNQEPVNHLAVVYDRTESRFQLYVNGNLEQGATVSVPTTWQSTGGLQVGRALVGEGWGEYLKGSVDDIRAYSGALAQNDINTLAAGFGEPCFCG